LGQYALVALLLRLRLAQAYFTVLKNSVNNNSNVLSFATYKITPDSLITLFEQGKIQNTRTAENPLQVAY